MATHQAASQRHARRAHTFHTSRLGLGPRRGSGEHQQEAGDKSDSSVEMAPESLVKETMLKEELTFPALLSLYSNIR